jgi:2,4-dienoyl-CoA reductase-like NADH-dependent reductase (Old Yellow Enzyme family)
MRVARRALLWQNLRCPISAFKNKINDDNEAEVVMPGLFDPLKIKGLTLKNRIVMAPMANNMATEQGEVTDKHLNHYVARAEANMGLIIVEHTYVVKSGRIQATQLAISEDSHVAGLKRLASAIREAGAASAIQITHGGSRSTAELAGQQPVSPSGVMIQGDKEQSRALTEEEIGDLVRAFAAGARRAAEAGFDVIEIHSAHGYLLGQFLSPLSNHRSDKYGGDLRARLNFAREVIAAIKQSVGNDFPLFCRLGADDLLPGGLTAEDGQQAAKILVEAGVDVIDVSGGIGGPGIRMTEQGFFVPLAEGVRRATNAPVIGVGNIKEPEYADRVVRDGRIDLVALGRVLLADPQWAIAAAKQLGVA